MVSPSVVAKQRLTNSRRRRIRRRQASQTVAGGRRRSPAHPRMPRAMRNAPRQGAITGAVAQSSRLPPGNRRSRAKADLDIHASIWFPEHLGSLFFVRYDNTTLRKATDVDDFRTDIGSADKGRTFVRVLHLPSGMERIAVGLGSRTADIVAEQLENDLREELGLPTKHKAKAASK
jgi:hypothetical protein